MSQFLNVSDAVFKLHVSPVIAPVILLIPKRGRSLYYVLHSIEVDGVYAAPRRVGIGVGGDT